MRKVMVLALIRKRIDCSSYLSPINDSTLLFLIIQQVPMGKGLGCNRRAPVLFLSVPSAHIPAQTAMTPVFFLQLKSLTHQNQWRVTGWQRDSVTRHQVLGVCHWLLEPGSHPLPPTPHPPSSPLSRPFWISTNVLYGNQHACALQYLPNHHWLFEASLLFILVSSYDSLIFMCPFNVSCINTQIYKYHLLTMQSAIWTLGCQWSLEIKPSALIHWRDVVWKFAKWRHASPVILSTSAPLWAGKYCYPNKETMLWGWRD